MIPRRPFAGFLLCMLAAVAGAAEDSRRYEEGPLTADDFRGEVQDIRGYTAKTATQFKFDYRYKYKTNARGTTVSLDSITLDAYIRRDQSWNRHPDNAALLDHEQGHADIAQIHCLQARLAFRKKHVKGMSVSVMAASLKEGIAALEREVKKEIAEFEKAARAADADYDRNTTNGLGPKQAEWRRVQQETLKQLEAEWGKKK